MKLEGLIFDFFLILTRITALQKLNQTKQIHVLKRILFQKLKKKPFQKETKQRVRLNPSFKITTKNHPHLALPNCVHQFSPPIKHLIFHTCHQN